MFWNFKQIRRCVYFIFAIYLSDLIMKIEQQIFSWIIPIENEILKKS